MRIAIIGFGTIAKSAHVPAMAAVGGYALKAAVTLRGQVPEGVRGFASAEAMLAAMAGELDAVVIATPPDVRSAIAHQCLDAGLDLLLEKPPATTLGEIAEVAAHAEAAGRVLFASWHSQHAPAVEQARALLAGRRIRTGRIEWREDVNKWHPGQDWVWRPGGFGVFDPGINALSIMTRIMPGRLIVEEATLSVPEGRQSPIAAELSLSSPAVDERIAVTFDWNPIDQDVWSITLALDDGRTVALHKGGSELSVDGERRAVSGPVEYEDLFASFAKLVRDRQSRVDVEPLRIVEDAYLRARREMAPAFVWSKA